jgi:peptidoglycan hydrolase-like protein with peptidoglycan-binding domain
MSDSTPARTPSSVERMSSTSAAKSGGMGSMLTILLVVACVFLIGACFYISNGKRELQTTIDKQMTDLNDLKATVTQRDNTILSNTRDIAALRSSLNTSIPLSRLPAAALGATVNETIAKIQQLADAPKMADTSTKTNATPVPPTNDTPAAWMETIAKQVAKGSINTKEATGNDAAKVQMHKGIQIVLAKIGVFNKAPTGASADTYEAVVAFQKANKLTADGIIGKGTWGKVRERLEATAHAGQ